MTLVKRVLAVGGWLAHIVNQPMMPGNLDHDRATRPRWLLVVCGGLGLFAAWLAFLAVTAPNTTVQQATVAAVAAGRPLQGGSAYVSVTGRLGQTEVSLCSSAGSCQVSLAVLLDKSGSSSIFIVVDGELPSPGPDGSVSVQGLVTNTAKRPDAVDWPSLAQISKLAVPPSSAYFLDSTWNPINVPASIVLSLLLLGLPGWIAAGWFAGTVPFVPLAGFVAPVAPTRAHTSTLVYVTGIVTDETGVPRRYRDRPGCLKTSRSGFQVHMKRWVSRYVRSPRAHIPYARIDLDRSRVSDAQRGTACLALRTRPAIRLVTATGPLLLGFDDSVSRDHVLASLSGIQSTSVGTVLAAGSNGQIVVESGRPTLEHDGIWADGRVSDAGAAVENETIIGDTIGNWVWIKDVGRGVAVGSAWRLLALAGPGEPAATTGAAACALLAIFAWEMSIRILHMDRRTLDIRLASIAGLVATIAMIMPLGFHIGHGELASGVLLLMGIGVVLDRPRVRRGG